MAARVAADEKIAFVDAAELRALWDRRHAENLNILDVRTADEYAAGHVAGAVWAPGGQAVQATDEYVAVRTARIVLVCDTTTRSVMTASWLTRMGFPNVAVLRGGLPAWTAAGGAVERGHPSPVPVGLDAARASVATVTATALDAELRGARPPLVLNVDQSDAYARAHVPGAAWLCRSRLELRIPTVAPDRAAPIVVTCGDGAASTLAAATLGRLGYTAVRVLEGGMRALGRGRTRRGAGRDAPARRRRRRGAEALRARAQGHGGLPALGGTARRRGAQPAPPAPGGPRAEAWRRWTPS